MTLGEDIEALVAGELSPEDAERVLARIATEPEAAAELDEALQMRGLGHELGASEGQLARRRRTRTIIGFATLAVAAAAALVLYLGRRDPKPDDLTDRVFASLAPHRQLEPRLSWPAADRYRPYDPPRAATTKPETLSFELLAEVEKAGDARALPAAQLLTGNIDAATAILDKAGETADALADRAAVALVRHDAERALVAAAAALDNTPTHPQARWNRALALQALGLDRSAAAAFDDIAAAHEPGWSDEAKTQASALHAQRKRRDEAWAKAQELGNAMVGGGAVPLDQVAAFPGLMRLYFYDAMRSAGTADRVKELLPLADALDAVGGGDVLRRYVDRVAAASFDKRHALAARYPALAGGTLDAKGARTLIDDARAAGQDDLVLGALLLSGPQHTVLPSDLSEYDRLAHATGDPWFELLASEQTAHAELLQGDISAAESTLREPASRCETGAIAYRCNKVWWYLIQVYQTLHRPAASAKALLQARKVAAATSPVVADGLLQFASVEADERDDTNGRWQALAGAYVEELDHIGPEQCDAATLAREAQATSLANRYELEAARRVLAARPSCAPFSLHLAWLLVRVLDRHDAAAVADFRAKLTALRDDPSTSSSDRVLVEDLEGVLDIDTPAGREELERVIATPGDDPRIAIARASSYEELVQDAGRHSAWDRALALLARERGAATPDRCTLGIGAGHTMTVFVSRGPNGEVMGAAVPRPVGEGLGAAATPSAIQTAVAGCPMVDVFAQHPYYGRSDLLPSTMIWRFRTAGTLVPPGTGPLVVVANIPPAPGLAPLNPVEIPRDAVAIEGPNATPAHVVSAMQNAGFVEIHSHGLADVGDDPALLVLAPDTRGTYVLSTPDIVKAHLTHHPIVVLAACDAATSGHAFHGPGGLADAFIAAGASAVVASAEPINDAAAPKFFEQLRARIAGGKDPALALGEERVAWTQPAERAWIDHLVVFQ